MSKSGDLALAVQAEEAWIGRMNDEQLHDFTASYLNERQPRTTKILINSGRMCPYCHEPSELIDSKEIYGRSYGMAYMCKRCDAYVGTHKGTEEALGRLANKDLRTWKKNAHAAFDPLWKEQGVERSQAYVWMANKMGLPIEEAHIGMFDIDQCKKLIELIKERK
jgi:hypothetical protein